MISLTLLLGLCPVAKADFTFGEPVNLGPPVNTTYADGPPSISADGLELFFDSDRPGGAGDWDIWIATRQMTEDPWREPVNLGPNINSDREDWSPSITADGMSLFFCSQRSGGYGGYDIWISTQQTSERIPEGYWGTPVNLGPIVNSATHEAFLSVSPDGLWLFLSEYIAPFRDGGFGGGDIWLTRRADNSDPWGRPVNLGPNVNTRAWDTSSDIAPHVSTLYLTSDRPGPGGEDLWEASIIPIVDFNGDGIVDSTDICIMVDHWGENYPLCDIGPTPLVDGIVDVEDLIVLAEHLFEEVPQP